MTTPTVAEQVYSPVVFPSIAAGPNAGLFGNPQVLESSKFQGNVAAYWQAGRTGLVAVPYGGTSGIRYYAPVRQP